jgi:uncharacterized coiled-coil protein SlyX
MRKSQLIARSLLESVNAELFANATSDQIADIAKKTNMLYEAAFRESGVHISDARPFVAERRRVLELEGKVESQSKRLKTLEASVAANQGQLEAVAHKQASINMRVDAVEKAPKKTELSITAFLSRVDVKL